jgi:integrase
MLYVLDRRRPVLIDTSALPRYWPAVWTLMHGGGLADETLKRKLRHIDALYEHADISGIQLDDALSRLQFDVLENVLESFFISLRNAPEPSSQVLTRWTTAFQFARDTCLRISKNPQARATLEQVHLQVSRLDQLYLGLRPKKKHLTAQVRAIPRQVVAELLDLIAPGSPTNPFCDDESQWRVFCLVTLLLYQGLRRGEALILRADSIQGETDPRNAQFRWRLKVPNNVPEDDPRAEAPSLKTVDSLRVLPMTVPTANIVQTYLENYRGKVNHPYLLSSVRGLPLSSSGVGKIFHKITKCLSAESRSALLQQTGERYLIPHALRHTCAVLRMKQLIAQGLSPEQAMAQLRSFFGWARSSVMPLHYAKAALDERLNESWNDQLDSRLDLLRSLPQ